MSQLSEILQLRDYAINFGLACVRTRIGHLGTGKEKIIFEIRDSLIYRAWAVNWHVKHLKDHHCAFEKELQNRIPEAMNSPQLLFDHACILHYLFDDIVFNCASMFDYIGNLVGLAYLGTTKSRLKWNGAVKSAHDKKNVIHSTPVSEKLVTIHREWVDPLMGYRGDTIHHKINLGKATHTFDFSSDSAELKVQIPPALAKVIYKDEAEVNMIDGAGRIAETTGKFCNEILICMERTLEPNYW